MPTTQKKPKKCLLRRARAYLYRYKKDPPPPNHNLAFFCGFINLLLPLPVPSAPRRRHPGSHNQTRDEGVVGKSQRDFPPGFKGPVCPFRQRPPRSCAHGDRSRGTLHGIGRRPRREEKQAGNRRVGAPGGKGLYRQREGENERWGIPRRSTNTPRGSASWRRRR